MKKAIIDFVSWIMASAMIAGVWAGYNWYSSGGHGSFLSPSEEEYAQSAAKQEITNALRAPASAKFGEMKTVEHKGKEYTVEATVDAQNAFGALLRSHFCAFITIVDATHYKGNAVEWDHPCTEAR